MYNKTVEAFIERPSSSHQFVQYLSKLNLNQATDLIGDIFGHVYWIEKGAKWAKPHQDKSYVARCHRLICIVNRLVEKKWFSPEINCRGNTIVRSSAPSFARFYLENVTSEPGEYIYNDGYTCCITLPQELAFVCFCEGDVTRVSCSTIANYEAEYEAERIVSLELR